MEGAFRLPAPWNWKDMPGMTMGKVISRPAFLLGRLARHYHYSARVNPYGDVEDKLEFERGWHSDDAERERNRKVGMASQENGGR